MYSLPHSAVAFGILKASIALDTNPLVGLCVGVPLAIISHYPVDYLREKYLGKVGEIKFDTLLGFIALLCSYFSGQFIIYFIATVCGNLFDIIDKKFYLAKFYPQKFKATYYFHKQKKGINFTLNQTKITGVVSFIIIILLLK